MLTLDELTCDWLSPAREEDFSLPAITNFRGVVQAAWDISGIQNWVHAPNALPTQTARMFVSEEGRYRRFPRPVEYRWSPYEILRRSSGVTTATRLPEDGVGGKRVVQRIRFEQSMRIALVFGGLARVWRYTDYWNLPPEDVPMLNVTAGDGRFDLTDTKTFGRGAFFVPGELRVYDDLLSWLEGDEAVERGRIGVAEIEVEAGDEICWQGVQGCGELEPLEDVEGTFDSARELWERTWAAAFTPGNEVFSGHLPDYGGPLKRLYAMSVMTLLVTRRLLGEPEAGAEIATGGQCVWAEEKRPLKCGYVIAGPEGAPTTCFLWELEFQAPILARLDPDVLRDMLEAFMRVDLHKHWGVEMVSGAGTGMGYGVNAGAFLSAVRDYVRITGDKQWALDNLEYLKTCGQPEMNDYGDCQHILECVSSYEHVVPAFNALEVQGLRFLAELTGEEHYAAAADTKAKKVLELYAGGPFACLQPDGSRRVVKTILDFVYVGRAMTADIPEAMRHGMVEFFKSELQTDDWLYALSPSDTDALTKNLPTFQTYRADHQATGSYDGWPAHAAAVLCRFGHEDEALAWLKRIEALTREGPFGQAHLIHSDGAKKASFFNGNMYLEPAGCAFATVLLEEIDEHCKVENEGEGRFRH